MEAISAREALERLRAGNRRFVAGSSARGHIGETQRLALTQGQDPFAILLGCSDSRVPAELVFDQGLGDLFVIRVAGNIVAPSQVGSVEFAAHQFGTRLVVVMGHTACGAVKATIKALGDGRGGGATQVPALSRNIRSIGERIRPAVEPLLRPGGPTDPDKLLAAAVRANIRASVDQLRHGSEILEGLIARAGLLIVGAEYSLETGEVDFFDGA